MKSLLLVIIFSAGQLFSLGQNNKEQAYKYGCEAIRLMDEEKNYQQAIKLLRKAQALDEQNIVYSYEIGYVYFIQKRYDAAIKLLKKLQKEDAFNERFYHLLGTCYDLTGDAKKAEKTFLEGIEDYPLAGELYTELGGLQYRKGNIDRAVSYWEKGIQQVPNFASNYYWASKMYLNSSEPIWGVLYGELFMNLERNSSRTAEMGKMLFDTYQGAFHAESDSIGWFSLSERARTYRLLVYDEKEEIETPFQVVFGEAFEAVYVKWLQSQDIFTSKETLSIGELVSLRKSFIQYWFKQKHPATYSNVLLDWHKELIDKGYFEAYHYWLLAKGEPEIFEAWLKTHEWSFGAFMKWFKDHPLQLNQQKSFYRLQYVEDS